MRQSLRSADPSTLRLLDAAVLTWLVLWLVVGGWVGYTTWELSELGDTVTSSGEATQSAAEALQAIGQVPVVGERPAELGTEIRATGEEVAVRGQEVKRELRQLAVLLALSIALIPSTPVVGLYGPLRMARRRESRALAGALASHRNDPGIEDLLAHRALHTLPYDVVAPLVSGGVDAGAAAQRRALADAELERLGVRRV